MAYAPLPSSLSSPLPLLMMDKRQEYARFVLLGLPTWALVDGTWAALSQLANTLPEGYNISAYLILSLTIGNIFPLTVGYFLKNSSARVLTMCIRSILVVGFVTGILMAVLWKESVRIGGQAVSLPLYILFFAVGACSSTSNVTHFTFVSTYAASNTTALATGFGLGSMIAGLLGILQGLVLINHGFSVTDYYLVLASLYVPAFVVFVYINYDQPTKGGNGDSNNANSGGVDIEQVSMKANLTSSMDQEHKDAHGTYLSEILDTPYDEWSFLCANAPVLSLQMLNSSLGYGVVPAIISFACGKFRKASLVLLLATGIAATIDPIFRATTYYIRIQTITGLWTAGAVLIALVIGLLICATLPASSSLYQGNGGILPVFLYVTFNATFGFTNTCVFRYYKDSVHVHRTHVQHAYRWSGIASQTGALLGSILAFSLVVSNSL